MPPWDLRLRGVCRVLTCGWRQRHLQTAQLGLTWSVVVGLSHLAPAPAPPHQLAPYRQPSMLSSQQPRLERPSSLASVGFKAGFSSPLGLAPPLLTLELALSSSLLNVGPIPILLILGSLFSPLGTAEVRCPLLGLAWSSSPCRPLSPHQGSSVGMCGCPLACDPSASGVVVARLCRGQLLGPTQSLLPGHWSESQQPHWPLEDLCNIWQLWQQEARTTLGN